MKTRFCILFLILTVPAFGQVSYWFQGWERKPDAAQAQAYFMVPGLNVTFGYDSNHVIINTATNVATTNFIIIVTNTLMVNLTNIFYLQSNPSNFINNVTNYIMAGTNIVFRTNSGVITVSVDGSLATNTYAGITNALHFIPATNNSGPWYLVSTTNTVHTNTGAGAVKVIGSGSAVAMQVTGGGNGGFATKGQIMGIGSHGEKTFFLYDSSQVGPPNSGIMVLFGNSTENAILGEFNADDRSLGGDQRRSIIQFGKNLYTTVGSDIVFFPDAQVNTVTFQMNENGGTAIGSSAHLINPPTDGLWVIGATSLDNDLINTDGAGSLFAGVNVITPLYITDDVPGITTNLITIAGPSIYRSTTFSNGIIVKATTVLYTNAFGAMALTNTGSHLTLAAANTYTTVTNWDYLATNRFTGMPPLLADGSLTNVNAGMYRISFSLSCFGGVGDGIEADVALNGVPSEFCAAHSASGTVSKNTCLGGVTVMYLAANTRISLMVKNVNSTTMTITHAQVTVGTP